MPHQCTTCGRTFEDGSKDMLSGCPDCGGNKFQFKPAGATDGNAGAGSGAASAATAPKKAPESARTPGGAQPSDAPETGGDQRGNDHRETDDRSSAVDRAAATVRDWVGKRDDSEETAPNAQGTVSTRNDAVSARDDAPERGPADSTRNDPADESAIDATPGTDDSAQASARSDVVSPSELPDDPPQRDPVRGPVPESDAEANVVDAPDDENPGLKELREELNSQFESIRIVEPGQYELNLMELYEREEYIISLQEDGKYVIEVPDAWDATER